MSATRLLEMDELQVKHGLASTPRTQIPDCGTKTKFLITNGCVFLKAQCRFSPVSSALKVVGTLAVISGTFLIPGQHVHQQVGVVQAGLPPLGFGVTHWEQKLW